MLENALLDTGWQRHDYERVGSVKYIDYNSKPILFLDFEGAASDHDVLELSEKASMLVKLGARNKLFVLYNMKDLQLTRRVLVALNRLMANASAVERRVLFGLDDRYKAVVDKVVQMLRLERNTQFSKSYTDAVNTLTDDSKWVLERRHLNLPVAEEHRQPVKVYTEEDFLDMEGEGRLIRLPDFDFKLED